MHCVGSSMEGGIQVEGKCPDYSTGNPEVFGPVLWNSLHIIAANFPEHPDPTHISACENFLVSLPSLIPCSKCGHHFDETLQSYIPNHPDVCRSRANLSVFLCEAHNIVNMGIGHKSEICDPDILQTKYGSSPLCLPGIFKKHYVGGDPGASLVSFDAPYR